MTRRLLLLCLFALPSPIFAQHFSHPLSAAAADARRSPALAQASTDTIHVLAVRVQFQKDNESRTTGDGTFNLSPGPADTALDAPPHDGQYFLAHLKFLQNYFQRVSKGRVIVEPTLVDSVVTLPSQMQAYSPERGASNLPVANLARDTWHLVDSLHLVTDFNRYQSFVVFHAGAGRDIDLVAELGYDPTPYDIPSLYFGLSGLRTFYGASFAGFPVQGNSTLITNTMVIPETESRLLPGATGDVPLILGINGLLCSSLGNYLGLPDLFNTATGASGIGRFGLMDGQAIFSFAGAFPPEPSAWEKYWLGWMATPVIGAGDTTLSLPAAALADTAYRVPISSEEYFLIENRSRDPHGTGVTVTTLYRGNVQQQTFTRDVTGFSEFDLSSVKGVVTDVTIPDWSLPGATDIDGTFYDGGILIWHIDESVIARGIATDAVNADADHRGVNLMEADGSQDIGQSYAMFTAGSGSEQGTVLDFWFQGNIAPAYKNAFSPTTLPSSVSNYGADSHITISDFSGRAPRMTFRVQRGDTHVSLLQNFPKITARIPSARALVVPDSSTGTPWFMLAETGAPTAATQVDQQPAPSSGRVFAWKVDGLPALPGGTANGMVANLQIGDDVVSGPIVGPLGSSNEIRFVIGVNSTTPGRTGIRGYRFVSDGSSDSLAAEEFFLPLPRKIVAPPAANSAMIAVGAAGGTVYFLRFDGSLADSVRPTSDTSASIAGISAAPGPNAFVVTTTNGTVAVVEVDLQSVNIVSRLNVGAPIAGPAVQLSLSPGNPFECVFATTTGDVYLTGAALGVQPGFPIRTGATIASPPALADIDGDGTREIIVYAGGKIYVYHLNGAAADFFPVTLGTSMPIASAPVIADVDGDGKPEIVAVTADGLVGAYTTRGKMAVGFPLAAGHGTQDVAVTSLASGTPSQGSVLLVASSDAGGVHAWRTSSGPMTIPAAWPQYQHDALHSGMLQSALPSGPPLANALLADGREYNWPNPVYGPTTHIRYYITEATSVHIKIFTVAGDLVTELSGPTYSNMDNEVAWDVSGVQSGVYFARIEADGPSGNQVRIIKIAVVR